MTGFFPEDMLPDEKVALRARVAKLEAALRRITGTWHGDGWGAESPPAGDDAAEADAYISVARAALTATPSAWEAQVRAEARREALAILSGPMPPEVERELRELRGLRSWEPVEAWHIIQRACGVEPTGAALEHDQPVDVPPTVINRPEVAVVRWSEQVGRDPGYGTGVEPEWPDASGKPVDVPPAVRTPPR